MKKQFAMLWAMAAMALFVSGCSKDAGTDPGDNPPPGVTNESLARIYFANNDEFVNNDEQTIDDQDIEPTDYTIGEFGKVDTAITPLRWGRFVRQVVRTVTDTVAPGDTIAIVHVHKVITGELRIRGINPNGDTVLVQKAFTDTADRNLIFKRVGREIKRFWFNWIPVATSLVAGGTVPPNSNIAITQVQLVTPGGTITVTDPLRYFLRYWWKHAFTRGDGDIPQVQSNALDTIRATIVSNSADTDLVALRFGVGTFFKRRMRMHLVSEVNNGNGTFTRVFEVPFRGHAHRGWFHAAVDAATHATLFDDTAPYSVSWWGIPYRVF
jgi:hypothetical protein